MGSPPLPLKECGAAPLGANKSNQVVYFPELMDSNPLFLTGNTSTVYAINMLDLKKDGPTVVEIPAGAGPGTVNDAYFRFVIDMGAPGPDKGKGGKYLILPPDYEGDLQGPIGCKEQVINGEQYFVAKSTSYVNLVALRGFLVDGRPDTAADFDYPGENFTNLFDYVPDFSDLVRIKT